MKLFIIFLLFSFSLWGESVIQKAFNSKGYHATIFPLKENPVSKEHFDKAEIKVLTNLELFPEGPVFRYQDKSYFYAGNDGLSRITSEGKVYKLIEKPGGGGTHILPDQSILLIGKMGLRRVYPDGRIALLADGEKIGAGNDITMDANGTVYFSVPSKGVYRLESGAEKKVELVVDKRGLNGLDVDPNSEFLYINRGRKIVRHALNGISKPLGAEELVYEFIDKTLGGADGCTFDAHGYFYLMHFKSGTISVLNPESKSLVLQHFCGTKPATNLAFSGPQYRDLMLTVGSPKYKNCKILELDLDVQGFCGHPGSTEYRELELLNEKVDASKF